uniref:MAM domain-containing protein n=1 Tax=Acrobeloides nanus TaxID=290746 RepID=A0A914EP96_9BILA
MDLRKFLGGDIELDLSTWNPIIKMPSIFGQIQISHPSDLNCDNFDAWSTPVCRWRNEWTRKEDGDELDWLRAKNGWGENESIAIFGTNKRATGYYIFTGSRQKLSPNSSALLVSDPIQCQEGDGRLNFRYWTSPGTKIRVCVRRPGSVKTCDCDWCSTEIIRGDPGPAEILIPGSILYEFEIVIEASHFDYDSFGFTGGMVILDDISYNAAAVYNCKDIPHVDPLPTISLATCQTVSCSFDLDECLNQIRSTGWRVEEGPVGNLHTGIRMGYKGNFIYAKGTETKILPLGPFSLSRQGILEFCYYIACRNTFLSLYATLKNYDRILLYKTEEISIKPHEWLCRQVILEEGEYEKLEITTENSTNPYAYIGLDNIRLLDPITFQDLCAQPEVEKETLQASKSLASLTAKMKPIKILSNVNYQKFLSRLVS